MIKCTNGLITCTVTEGAYDNYFKTLGYKVIGDNTRHNIIAEEDINADVIDAVDVFDELLEKPISQWSKTEVKEFANAKGIDISETRNVSQAKEIIKTYIENK